MGDFVGPGDGQILARPTPGARFGQTKRVISVNLGPDGCQTRHDFIRSNLGPILWPAYFSSAHVGPNVCRTHTRPTSGPRCCQTFWPDDFAHWVIKQKNYIFCHEIKKVNLTIFFDTPLLRNLRILSVAMSCHMSLKNL